MAQENHYQMPRRVNDYHYAAAGDCMQAVDAENPYENNHFPDIRVAPTPQVTQLPPSTQSTNNDEKPKRKLSRLQIAIICALVLNFALAACGIVLLMLGKMDSTRSDLQMQKQTADETEKRIAEIEAKINGSANILENNLRKHERLSSEREIRYNRTRKEMLHDFQMQKQTNGEMEERIAEMKGLINDFQIEKQANRREADEKFDEIKVQINVSSNVIEGRLREYERLSDSRESRNNMTQTKILEDLVELRDNLQNQSEQINRELQLLKDAIRGPSIRLVGGSTSYGRVEILYKGIWGTVCDDHWDTNDATVVCKMLGFQRATGAPGGARYGHGTGQIWLENVDCTGTESTIWDCTKRSWGAHDCSHGEDASVECA